MINQNIIYTSLKFVLVDLVGDVFYFPFWWYTKGVKKMALASWGLVKGGQERLALKIWLVNIFKPMFGQYDWQGKLISFFMRLIQIIIRSVLLVLWFIFCVLLFLLWLVAPIVVIWQIIFQISMGVIGF